MPLRRGLRARRIRWVLLGALCLGAVSASAQPGTDPAVWLGRIEAAYAGLDYTEAEALAWRALDGYEVFSPAQLVRIHTTLALILHARGDEREAGDQFRAALSLDPGLTLDPLLVSPVTIAFFEEVKAARVLEPDAEPVLRYVQVSDPRPAATWRSAVLPGWGQRHKGESAKGWVITGLWVTTLAAGTAAHLRRRQAQRAYDEAVGDATGPAYETLRTWHRVRGGLLLGAAAVWTYAAADALLTGSPSVSSGPVEIGPAPGGLRLRYRF